MFLFIDYYLVYTAHPLKPDPKSKGKDNTDYTKLKQFKEQAVLLKEEILEKKLSKEEKEIIIGKKKPTISKKEAHKNVANILKRIEIDKKQKKNSN